MEKDINKMTKQEFLELQVIKDMFGEKPKRFEFDSIVLVPTRLKHDSGFNYYSVVPCLYDEPIGITEPYDTFSINNFRLSLKNETTKYYRFGIDCLRTSSLMRIFFEKNRFDFCAIFHEMQER